MSVPVFTSLDRYRGAIAELPATAAVAASPEGAVVVLDGAGRWWNDVGGALSAGAVAVVVSRPRAAPAEVLAAVADLPIVLERPLVRPDLASEVVEARSAARPPSAIVVECHAPAPALEAALAEALGWSRLFAGEQLEVQSARFTGGRGMALIEAGGAASVSLVVATSTGAPPDGRLRVTALGETLLELEIEDQDVRFAATDASSRRIWPTRFESPQRLALRRAAAVQTGQAPPDVAEFARDRTLAEAILRGGAAVRAEASTS
ncbi:hypothetical protein G5T42_06600 [Microbacterium sp. 4R-513]|uniref:hypothetical protein n=1 Tax=Microbacterium sp. 4R-513 TaxID=2567934 RepID=UPI0013E12686|nr:hypothetical protein [Microbacterium sp. 4R-513]QIG39194.1 hypothetical protein G5T42_06600 [Microbacterium sp. 4R-513]